MAFRKNLNSETDAVAIIAGGDQRNLFGVGFKYMMGDRIYEVRECMVADNAQMRRLVCSDGTVEELLLQDIIDDIGSHDPTLKNHGVTILFDPARPELFAPAKPVVKNAEAKPKMVKKMNSVKMKAKSKKKPKK